jgi:formylglycine-generating enzyme required for sulfatase activity
MNLCHRAGGFCIALAVAGGFCGCATLPSARAPGDLSRIPAGFFEMGNSDTNYASMGASESPAHRVWVDAIGMERREVSKALWDEVRTWGLANGYRDLPAGEAGFSTNRPPTPDHPVTQVNWYDVVKWCNARSQKEGLPPAYYTSPDRKRAYTEGQLNLDSRCVDWSANGYRLPTEAEWEKAARGGLEGQFYPWPGLGGPCKQHLDPGKANYLGSRTDDGTTPAGYFDGRQEPAGPDMANGFGLYDMAGNVWEWCWDYCGEIYYAESPAGNPRGPDTAPYGIRIKRGGSWRDRDAADLRCARRNLYDPGTANPYTGFRCVRRP